MNRISYIAPIVFLILFSLDLSARDYSKTKTQIEYKPLEYKTFNQSILSGKFDLEDWSSDPVIVSLKFIGPFEGQKQSIERINESAESLDKTLILITNEGLLDDSVMGIKYKIVLKKAGDVWLIQNAGKAVKCWPGRGHSNYSPEPCN